MGRKYDTNADYRLSACIPINRKKALGFLARDGEFGVIAAQLQPSDDDLEHATLRALYFTGGMDAANDDLHKVGEFRRDGRKGRVYTCTGFHTAHDKDDIGVVFRHLDDLPNLNHVSDLALEALALCIRDTRREDLERVPFGYRKELYERTEVLLRRQGTWIDTRMHMAGFYDPGWQPRTGFYQGKEDIVTPSAQPVRPNGSQVR